MIGNLYVLDMTPEPCIRVVEVDVVTGRDIYLLDGNIDWGQVIYGPGVVRKRDGMLFVEARPGSEVHLVVEADREESHLVLKGGTVTVVPS